MRSIITLVHAPDDGMLVGETYGTLKKRMFNANDFIEVTVGKREKILLNKKMILGISPREEKKKKKKKR